MQTVLLMTYWSDPENSPHRDIWDWIGACNTQAHSIGLNNDPSSATDINLQTRRLRTRLWWCLYSRDRLIAMGMRRPLQVNEVTSNVPMLRLEDFDFEPFSPSAIALFRCRQLEDVSHQKRLATMFIEKVKLCQCIGRVLFAQYAPSQRKFGPTDRTTVVLVPRQASESEFTRCSQKLDSWLGALPKDAQFIPTSRRDFSDGEDVLLLHGAMLRMLYHATSSALHRPWAAHTKDQSNSRIEWRNTARTKMHDAATGITHIIQGLNQLNLTRFLPQSGVTVILPAAVAHLSNSMSGNPALRESSIYNFHRCVHVLHCLKDIYPAANFEFANLEAAIKMQSSNYSSNTFFEIMQYSFDDTTASHQPEKPSNADSISTTHSLRHLADSSERLSPTPRPRASSMQERGTRAQRKHGYNSPEGPSHLAFNPSHRPLPNDFDGHFVSNTTTSADNPFNYLSIDFENFPSMNDPTNDKSNDSLTSGHDLDSMDWTQALFPGTPLSELGQFGPFDEHRRTQSLPNNHIPHSEQEDLFSFVLNDDEDGTPLRHHAASHAHGDITGDLDRDLGFQTEDEML
ncbi:uncharacterized protein N7459_006200 [Penicillium hispanicum]|uniref:uncharacterized protein n=1 Tax=Penicillium hispanicum TaxID=1080232 RepID=UPI00254076D8|nr:uncharacterized protein N7459_006200 [Penicillium hispanicum]KAJ5580215.1 hypothetical protein N7459_006200 [Penicillium hispanicum]